MSRRILRPGFVGAPDYVADQPHLSVDGMTPRGPNLSHWPGNRTPARYKADLSTGICLTFAAAPVAEQAEFLGDAESVVNDHYDTDGFLSMLAITRPDLAFAHEEVCLAAAATGDFQACFTRRGFAVDRIVANLAAEGSPVADEFAGLSGAAKALARYRWLLEHAPRVLSDPEAFAGCWMDAWRIQADELRSCRDGALQREVLPACGLSVVRTAHPVRRMTLNSLAGAYRVLHAVETPAGAQFRYHDRTESWFEVVTFTPPPRVELHAVAARLQELEGDADAPHRWCADAITEPVPEVWFGVDSAQAYGDVTRELGISRLSVETVRDVFAAHFAGGAG